MKLRPFSPESLHHKTHPLTTGSVANRYERVPGRKMSARGEGTCWDGRHLTSIPRFATMRGVTLGRSARLCVPRARALESGSTGGLPQSALAPRPAGLFGGS